MTKFGAAENKMERLTAKFAQRTQSTFQLFKFSGSQLLSDIFMDTTHFGHTKLMDSN